MSTATNNPDRQSRDARDPRDPGDPVELPRELRGLAATSPLAPQTIDSMSYFFDSKLALLPGVSIPLRSMLIAGEHDILVSPVGTVEEGSLIGGAPLVLVAPSLLHHIHLAKLIERHRPVALWGPPGLAEKQPALGPMHTFGVDPWPYAAELDYVLVEGAPRRNEVVFFHRSSRTIYTADLLLNICRPKGLLTSLALRGMGVHRRLGAAKMWRRWVTDRAAFGRSIDAILAWEFERIVVAHGDIVDENARDRFEIALRELQLLD
jgi:hypothetical protein